MDSLWYGLLDVLFPVRCLRCKTIVASGRRSVPLCTKHTERFELMPEEACRYCALPMAESGESTPRHTTSYPRRPVCGSCRKSRLELEFVAAGFQFTSILREVVSDWKFGFNPEWGSWLADRLARVVPGVFQPSAWEALVPIPLYYQRREKRGFNQANQLAQGLSESWGLPRRNLLEKQRRTDPQSSLGRSERLKNLKGSFSLSVPVEAVDVESVLLVDDIYTTGSTLKTAATVLKQGPVESVGAVVLARTLPEDPPGTITR